LVVKAHEVLGVYGGPDVSQAEFRRLCANAARQRRDLELAKVVKSFDQKIHTLTQRLEREMRELEADETELGQRRIEELGTHAENVLGIFSKSRRRMSTSLTKRRLTEQARADVDESRKVIRSLEKQIEALEDEKENTTQGVNERWGNLASKYDEISLAPYKKNVYVELFGIAWIPYHLVQVREGWIKLPGFSPYSST
jgi:chromosome segregation ATPase